MSDVNLPRSVISITSETATGQLNLSESSNSHFGENLFKSPASLYRNDIQETQERQSR
ncbi:hypothetical protein [Limnospira platensis]|uniref:Uncharacterized protein n=1 Tax=Limnospira platensis NIES-46 TaxID=1236695 RepID=A0A5M3T4V6_LIMPL|nr:hypothetical protein [Arthrospira platensis NCB002]QQW27155.1 hypothetical protein AP9108_17720 [Arthrospira sp. PCC 9108]BDT13818.1 hypothetical protein N39L_35410 [Arthrospira platensis NIES-39]GCE92920.1 hypothetical protein NIES46_09680 [Arthrospira platensis NIES-46]